MKLIKSSTEIITEVNGLEVLKTIEKVARTCYKSEDKITDESAEKIVKSLLKNGHEAMIEFYDITVKFTCDRGVSHEIVRHRVASYAQESTRYCNYSQDKFGAELTFIEPCWYDRMTEIEKQLFESNLKNCEKNYNSLVNGKLKYFGQDSSAELGYADVTTEFEKWSAQEARAILPNCLKTEINVKMNLREWRHFFNLRCAKPAHPQMRELSIPLLEKMHDLIPIIFDDLYEEYCR